MGGSGPECESKSNRGDRTTFRDGNSEEPISGSSVHEGPFDPPGKTVQQYRNLNGPAATM
jgi:hypothetical protein